MKTLECEELFSHDARTAPVPLGRTPATLRDVARVAGVHVSIASKVLNGTKRVPIRAQTRDRILHAARQLRYRRNAPATALRLSTTGALGLLVPTLRNPNLSEIIRGAFQRAWERGFVVTLAEDSSDNAAQEAYERLVAEGRIDGLLITSARPGSPLTSRFKRFGGPAVFVNRGVRGSNRNVVMRIEDAGRMAAEHLLHLGHRRLAHLAGPDELDSARRLVVGFVQAAEQAGIHPKVVHAEFDEAAGFKGMRKLLNLKPRATGVFVSNINQAVGAFAAARSIGCRIPDQVSVIGYDDDALAQFLEAPMTAIRMPLNELGSTAVDALIEQINGAQPVDVLIATAPKLIVRSSTMAPPS